MLPSSLGVTLTELLKGAHSQINYLDHQIQKLNNKRVVFLRRLSKKDLEILTWDNTIKHLHHNLHGATDHIQSIECQLKEMLYTPHEDKHLQKVPHTHSIQHPVTPENGPLSLPLSPLTSSLTGPSPRKVIPYVKPMNLQPDGYSWFMRPETEWLHLLSFYWNIPIPGQYYPNDFNQGVSLCGCTWNIGTDPLCQWHYNYFIKLFMNSPDGFKFLVDIKYVNKEYVNGAHWVHPNTVALFQEWYRIKHVSTGQTSPLLMSTCW